MKRKTARRLWRDLRPQEVATLERRVEVLLRNHYEHEWTRTQGPPEWWFERDPLIDGLIERGGGACPAAVPWHTEQLDGFELFKPCRYEPRPGADFCWAHGGWTWAEYLEEAERMATKDCEPDGKVVVSVDLGHLTLEGLAAAVGKVERHAAAVKAPKTAEVTLETGIAVRGSDGPHTTARISWELGG